MWKFRQWDSGPRPGRCTIWRVEELDGDPVGRRLINGPWAQVTRVVRLGQLAMAKVSIWTQGLGGAIGVLFSSAFVVLLAWFIGWSLLRRLWPRRKVAPGSARRAGAARGGVEALAAFGVGLLPHVGDEAGTAMATRVAATRR